jgi:uncharacterized OB-fold protein
MATESLAITWRRIPERYRLEGTCCKTCGICYFPPRKICPKCRRKGKIEPRHFCGKGKVYSFTEVTAPPEGFELEVPYILAIVELEEGPKITAQIVEVREPEIRIGDAVEAVFRKIKEDGEEGLIHYGFKFRKV